MASEWKPFSLVSHLLSHLKNQINCRCKIHSTPHLMAWYEIVFDDDSRDLLWASFFAGHEQVDRKPIELRLPTGDSASLPLEHFGGDV
jgi:hypothetical protein